MTEEYLNLDFEPNFFDSNIYAYPSSRNSDFSSDDTHQKSQIMKKNISKYEPILYDKILYRYEDDPEKYKKIRKRQQNRESANRVRGRQKNHMQDVHEDLIKMKQENQQLQMINAKLQAENNLLKQQVQFMQEVILKKDSQSINPPFQTMEATNTYNNKHIISISSLSVLFCFILLSGNSIGQEATVSAAEVNTQVTATPIMTFKPYMIGFIGALWVSYFIYLLYKYKKGNRKMKII